MERTILANAIVWGMPIVSMDAMRRAFFRDAGAKYGDIIYFSKPVDWRFQVPTPTASAHYVYFNFNLKNGPVVVEVPPAVDADLFGSLLDAWQVPLVDIGRAGHDAGRGGRYLLLPPGYNGDVPAGYFTLRPKTVNGYSMMRVVPESSTPAAVRSAVSLVKKLRLYRLAEASEIQVPRFIDMSGKLFDGIVRFDKSFYESLARMLDEESPFARDVFILERLNVLGIAKNKPFRPDPAISKLMDEVGAQSVRGFIGAAAASGGLHWPSGQWRAPNGIVGPETGFVSERDGELNVQTRGLYYFLACAPPKKAASLPFCLTTFVDGAGDPLSGVETYRLHVPAKVPVTQFWTATIYASDSGAFVREAARVEVSSKDASLKKNGDGSVDIYIGPKAPAGQESNWLATLNTNWFVSFRFYGAQPPLFTKIWQLPDVQMMR